MTYSQHFLASFIFFLIAIFESIVYTEIISQPYMVGLLLFLCGVGGWNLGIGFAKYKYRKRN